MHDELRFHVETRTEDLMRGGMERHEAERQARLETAAVASKPGFAALAMLRWRSALGRRPPSSAS
jgi:hypothetical protein